MVIDFHTHLFPDALAGRTLEKLSQISSCPYHADGTAVGTLARLQEWGADRAVVLHIATRPGQELKINRFALQVQQDHPALLCFGTVHPDSPDAAALPASIRAMGLHGIKLHPAYQKFFLREERYYPLYEAIADAGLPLTLHAGWDPVSPETEYAPPADIARVAKTFPKLTLIAAHMGGMMRYAEAEEHLCGIPNVYLDTAMSSLLCDPAQFERLVRAHGAERVLLGSDCPWNTLSRELAYLEASTLTAHEKDLIRGENARVLLGL